MKLFKFIAVFAALIPFSARAVDPSGTLPVLTINTENNAPIDSKETYVQASYSIDPKGVDGIEALKGTMQIRGRGNYTWWGGFVKKPYKIKLDKKAELLGMNKSKHFALQANADDNLGFLRAPLALEMSKMIGMAWTPESRPVEVILNGDYRGLYFLTENIRVDSKRVDVVDQEEEGVEPDVTGGWLCEIDNYDEPATDQIKLTDGDGNRLWVTHKSPEILNAEQEDFLRTQYTLMNDAVYIKDPESTEWEKYIDKSSLAKMFIVYELLDNFEGFNGSCYMHRQRGAEEKWKFGPVWDFGQVYTRENGTHIYEDPHIDWCNRTWIPQLVEKNSFSAAYKELFKEFVTTENIDKLLNYLKDYAESISQAAVQDAERYKYNNMESKNSDVMGSFETIKKRLVQRIGFLSDEYGVPVDYPTPSGIYLMGDINSWKASDEWEFMRTGDNRYELTDVTLSGAFKVADSSWSTHNWGGPMNNVRVNATADTPIELYNHNNYNDLQLSAPQHFNKVLFEITDPDKRARITLFTKSAETGVEKFGSANKILVEGRTMRTADGALMTICDITGRIVARNINTITLPGGLYIVNAANCRPLRIFIR